MRSFSSISSLEKKAHCARGLMPHTSCLSPIFWLFVSILSTVSSLDIVSDLARTFGSNDLLIKVRSCGPPFPSSSPLLVAVVDQASGKTCSSFSPIMVAELAVGPGNALREILVQNSDNTRVGDSNRANHYRG
jgi:hypothetical protein